MKQKNRNVALCKECLCLMTAPFLKTVIERTLRVVSSDRLALARFFGLARNFGCALIRKK
jgi:hypothetical protein